MDNFTEKEFEIALKETIFELSNGKKPTEEKRAFLLGGQPGAGKSGMTGILQEENTNIIVINGDEFRKKHPHYKELEEKYGKESVEYTKGFSGKMTEALINKLSDKGYNLIIEGTLRTTEVPLKTQQELSKKGYQVEMAVIQVKPQFSYLGTLTRYEEMIKRGLQPRATLEKDHQKVVDNIANNLSELYQKKVFSNIRLFNREGECLYSMNKTPEIDPGELIRKEFKRDLSEKEKKNLIVGYDTVINYMTLRNATKEEIKAVLDLKNTIENSLSKEIETPQKEDPWAKKLANDRAQGLSLKR